MRLKDSLVSSLQFCKAKDTELAWIDGVLDMRVAKVDTGVLLEAVKGEEEAGETMLTEDGGGQDPAMDVGVAGENAGEGEGEEGGVALAAVAKRAMKSLFMEDERELSDESDVIPTLEPLPTQEVRGEGEERGVLGEGRVLEEERENGEIERGDER